ncbi:cellulose binding domain-containing protein, partial [Dactylosporangium sp. NPDC005555]|uniref:cellulose-binding domain-containing protein n=1 Tax=Dactylosporangium sp. NPDC005555 TaxID=3154889 RepID=UPI0033BA44AC
MAGLLGGRHTLRARLALTIGAVVAVLTGLVAVVTTNAYAAAGCQVTYRIASQWPGGFTGDVAVKNLGDPINGWTLRWTFGAGQTVTQAWSATVTASGAQVTAGDAGYNGAIATNGTVSFGFNGSWTGSNPVPASFTLNGTVCTGGVSSASPSTSTSPSRSASASPSTSTSPQPTGDAMAAVAAMQPGWNLGNSLDATGADETSWGNPRVTAALLDNIRAQGFNSVRIPVTWGQHMGGAPNYTV